MSIQKKFGVNEQIALEGKWFKIDPEEKTEFKLRCAQTSHAVIKESIKAGSPSPAQEFELSKKLLVEDLLVDWKNLYWSFKEGEKETKREYSKEMAKRILDNSLVLTQTLSQICSNHVLFNSDKVSPKKKSTNP